MSTPEPTPEFEALLEFLKSSRGFDFTGYKRASLQRRINKRMQDIGIDGYLEYMDHLQVRPEEFKQLFDCILINVTSFFRDAPIWDFLIEEIVPQIIDGKKPEAPIRAWSAGCASGEEAYSIAIALAERLPRHLYRQLVKIYGTDVDEDALTQARLATYSAKAVETVPEHLREKYFEESAGGYVFDRELRRSVIFGRHDLVQDAPISRVDLLTCRNTLMYLNAETQNRVMDHLRFALVDGGHLLLGKSEMLFTQVSSLRPVDLKRRIFMKTEGEVARGRLAVPALPGNDHGNGVLPRPDVEAAFEAFGIAQLVVDQKGLLVLVNEQARSQFNVPSQAVGRPFQDLEVSYRPVELRSRLEEVAREHRGTAIKGVHWSPAPGVNAALDILVEPLFADGTFVGTSISFFDITQQLRMQDDLQRSNQELETAMEELQSTNEELETTNEELQSTNEELETVNEEMRKRSSELDRARGFFESVIRSVGSAVIVLDAQIRVSSWNERAADVWGLREDEVLGHSLFGLDFGLPPEQIRPLIKRCLAGESSHQETTVGAINRRGKSVVCRISCSPLLRPQGTVEGVILLIDLDQEVAGRASE